MAKNSIKTELKPSQVFDLLIDMVNNNVELAKNGLMPIAFNIEGKPGISKTSVVKQVAEQLKDFHYVRLNVAEIEVGDLIGFPITQYKVIKDKQIIWVNDKLLNDYIAKGYNHSGESRMSYAIPEWLIDRQDKPVILVLDDYNRGLPIMMNACMRITDEQETSSWKLPKGSTVILTCNPDDTDDMFNVSSLDLAQKTRFITIKMKADVDDWALNYAEVVGLPSPYINFLIKHKEVIHGTGDEKADQNLGNLRIWTKFFHGISIYHKNLKDNWTNVFLLGQNSLPEEHLILLERFINDKLDKLETPETLLTQDSKKTVKYLKDTIGEGNKLRNDIASIISRRITNYTIVNHKKFTKEMRENYAAIMEAGYLSPDLVILSIKKAVKWFPELMSNQKILKIAGLA